MPDLTKVKNIGLIIIFSLLTLSFARNTAKILQNSKRLETLKSDVRGLEAKRDALKTDIEYGRTDEFVEEKARNELGLIKQGEKLYLIPKQQPEDISKDRRLNLSEEIGENPWFKVKPAFRNIDNSDNFGRWVGLFM